MFFLFHKENNIEQKQVVFLQTVERLEAPSLLGISPRTTCYPVSARGRAAGRAAERCTRFLLEMLCSGISFLCCVSSS